MTGAVGRQHLFLAAPHTRHGHFDALDGLRGLAVLIVLLSHLSNAGMHAIPGVSLSGTGKSGVYLFFVLSAFLLTRALLGKPLSEWASTPLWLNYALRRIVRIWPLYLVVLLLSTAVTAVGWPNVWHYRLDAAALWEHLTLQAGQSVLWSIPVEFKYYVALPFVAGIFAWLWHRGQAWWIDALAAVVMVALAVVLWPPSAALVNDVRLGPYLTLFLCGAYAAAVHHRLANRANRSPARSPRVVGWWGLAAVVAALAWIATTPWGWALVTRTGFDPALNHVWFVFFGVCWSLLLLAVMQGPDWVRWGFANAPMRLLGVISFSAYLWHMVLLDGFRAWGLAGAWWAPWTFLAGTVGLSMLSFLCFERPWRNVRYAGRRPLTRPDAMAGH